MFHPVPTNVRFPALEDEIARFWKERQIFDQSLKQREGSPEFVFYEGPPTANGMPHPGHCLTRAIKDLFPRYRTMRGYHCARKAGWDTHGLPVEVEVCKELGIHSKEEIEAYGIEKFIHKCVESVWRYMRQWEKLTERLGFWIHLDEAYVTYHQSYVESVWWSLKNLFDRGLLYQGHKIVWWWAQGGTALSAGEVGQGYREVADPSVYVRFPLVECGTSLRDVTHLAERGATLADTDLLVWTTTPWTLPSNQFAAVHPELEYLVVRDATLDRRLIIASALLETIASKVGRELKAEAVLRGSDLIGLRYHPPFDYYAKTLADLEGQLKGGGTQHVYWRIVAADFVTTGSGTGIVHQAPAFGEIDYDVLLREGERFVAGQGPELLCAVAPDGKFTAEGGEFVGRWVKEADKDIARNLRHRGLLYHQEQYLHEYPFCWRADQDPLIQYPRQSWFIRTTQFKEAMLANNSQINWLPEHIKEGRFGNFLESNVDWALSRERYWGTPLPIWVCEETGTMEAVASYDELLKKPGVTGMEVWSAAKNAKPDLTDHLKVHKPYIDAITYDSPKATGKRMRRVPDVIDCWYDSGAMPFAQWGYPNQPGSAEQLKKNFPADFISEALDQTRGWFYSQLAISTLLFSNTGEEVVRAMAKEHGLDFVDLNHVSVPPDVIELVPESVARENSILPMSEEDGVLRVIMSDPLDYETQEKLRFILNRDVRIALAPREKIQESINRHYGQTHAESAGSMLQEFTDTAIDFTKTMVEGGKEEEVIDENSAPHYDYPHPFRNCIVLGLMLGEDGGKMSKSKRNYREPNEIFDRYGADALRWYFFANQPPWTSIRYSEQAIKDSIPEFQLRLWNVYSFFVIYANIDGFDPATMLSGDVGQLDALAKAKCYRPPRERSELDRWITSELNRTAAMVTQRMDAYDNYGACQAITAFVDALSNWYVRRSRDRFWSDQHTVDKQDAYWTLYESLIATSKLIAPFVPYLAEAMWQNLARAPFGKRAVESVHLCDFPTGDATAIDELLSARMSLVREIVSLGRAARMESKLKVRQPLSKVEVVLTDGMHQAWLDEHGALVCEELNVKQVEFPPKADQYVSYTVQPDLKRLGPKLGKRLPDLKKKLGDVNAAELLDQMSKSGSATLQLSDGPVTLDNEDLQVRLQAKPGWAAAQGSCGVVVLSTEITPALVAEGLARELVHAIQGRRRDLDCKYTDRIAVGIVTDSQELRDAAQQFAAYIQAETLATELKFAPLEGAESVSIKLGGHEVAVSLRET